MTAPFLISRVSLYELRCRVKELRLFHAARPWASTEVAATRVVQVGNYKDSHFRGIILFYARD